MEADDGRSWRLADAVVLGALALEVLLLAWLSRGWA
jgi:hypothetical protein